MGQEEHQAVSETTSGEYEVGEPNLNLSILKLYRFQYSGALECEEIFFLGYHWPYIIKCSIGQ
jgi:hypothetical protein